MKNKISIVDYNAGNLFSINNALKKLGYHTEVTDQPNTILDSDALVIPGVGSFKAAMKILKKKKLDKVILHFFKINKPILGICLGFQLLFSKSEEFGLTNGLNLIEGNIKSLAKFKIKSPNIGWYKLIFKNNKKKIITKNDFYYFVHSFFAEPKNKNIIFSYTKVGNFKFCSSILYKNVYGTQFHPEKSGAKGLLLIDKFFIDNGIQKI